MKASVYCTTGKKGIHSFYLRVGSRDYYLFSQNFRIGVQRYYRKGVILDEAMNISRSHGDAALIRTMKKIPTWIRYVEKEYELEVLRRTKKKSRMACAA